MVPGRLQSLLLGPRMPGSICLVLLQNKKTVNEKRAKTARRRAGRAQGDIDKWGGKLAPRRSI